MKSKEEIKSDLLDLVACKKEVEEFRTKIRQYEERIKERETRVSVIVNRYGPNNQTYLIEDQLFICSVNSYATAVITVQKVDAL